jgi:hypothetical protein
VNPTASSLPECQGVNADCTAAAAAAPAGVTITAIVTYQNVGGVITRLSAVCTARGPAAPALTEADVRAEIVKLVPHVAIGAAPAGQALVNLESLYWAQTPASRDLGVVTLLGHQVALTIAVASVNWDFGDGATARSNGPGRPFTATDHCGQKQCPDWFGHTYTQTGALTVTATVNWTGRYTVDGGAINTIQGTVAGPAATMALQVKQARAVLMPTN